MHILLLHLRPALAYRPFMVDFIKSSDGSHIEPVDLRTAIEDRYLTYALSTIMHRALPDVRDGLKPVHRRLLHVMRLLKLQPEHNFKKCARVVGEAIGRFHPHGEQAIYDALVRLAQDFSMRYPLIDGQGNFGNIDGDNAAAMRYTEARLTPYAMAIVEEIDEDTVDFRKTYDGEDEEPVVMPAAVPNILANGSSGIAVGMATSIPSHNLAELCSAALFLIKYPHTNTPELMKFIPGPDFATGGIIIESREHIVEAYTTGRGQIRVRACWKQENLDRGAYVIIVTEIPYQVQKSRLIKRIADLLQAKKLPLLADIRDESSEELRIVIEPKNRSVDPILLMEQLFKITELEQRIILNFNVISEGRVPRVMGIVPIINEWLEHRRTVLVRRSEFHRNKLEQRLEVLDGYLIVYLNIDGVIRIIREEKDPKRQLMREFNLTELQADAVLDMRLRSLRQLAETQIRTEHREHSKERGELQILLASSEKQWVRIGEEIEAIYNCFGPETVIGRRRTQFAEAPALDAEKIDHAMIIREPVTIIFSEKGWISAIKGHVEDLSILSFKADDSLRFAIRAESIDKIIMVATSGRFFIFFVNKLLSGRKHGEHVRLMIDLEDDHDIIAMFTAGVSEKYLVASTDGKGFIVREKDIIAVTRKGKQILDVCMPIAACICVPVHGDHVAVIGQNRQLIIFPLSELPELARGKGVRLQKYKEGGISDAKVFALEEGLSWRGASGRIRNIHARELTTWILHRAKAGHLPPRGFPKNNRFG